MDVVFPSSQGPFSWRGSKLDAINLLKPQSFHPACRLFPPDSDISSRDRYFCRCAQGIPHAAGVEVKPGTRAFFSGPANEQSMSKNKEKALNHKCLNKFWKG